MHSWRFVAGPRDVFSRRNWMPLSGHTKTCRRQSRNWTRRCCSDLLLNDRSSSESCCESVAHELCNRRGWRRAKGAIGQQAAATANGQMAGELMHSSDGQFRAVTWAASSRVTYDDGKERSVIRYKYRRSGVNITCRSSDRRAVVAPAGRNRTACPIAAEVELLQSRLEVRPHHIESAEFA